MTKRLDKLLELVRAELAAAEKLDEPERTGDITLLLGAERSLRSLEQAREYRSRS